MNNLMTTHSASAALTMSSQEIADLVESRHDNVRVSIERLAARGAIRLPPTQVSEIINNLGLRQQVTEYLLNKRDSYVVVAQLSPEFTARLVDRWQQLEQERQLGFDPTNDIAVLENLIKEKKERKALESIIEQNAPKVAFVDHFVDTTGSKSLRETAKILRMPERAMIDALLRDRALFRQSGNLLPSSVRQREGIFTVKTGAADTGHAFTQTRVTPRGVQWIAERYASELMGDA